MAALHGFPSCMPLPPWRPNATMQRSPPSGGCAAVRLGVLTDRVGSFLGGGNGHEALHGKGVRWSRAHHG